ncbi:MAG: hypothetical protein M0Z99_22795 [Betaproteobacteria bacterium]|jgi:hypothetical protein|nr:hypothetical protein [Betaproteobacteria bacterium]
MMERRVTKILLLLAVIALVFGFGPPMSGHLSGAGLLWRGEYFLHPL